MKIQTKLAAATATFVLSAASTQAALVAYWPMNEGSDGAVATSVTETIVSGGTFTDGASNATDAFWVNDATRGIVLHSPEKNDFLAGTQGIAANTDFTWSIWVKTADSSGHIMGSRGGSFHSINPTKYASSSAWSGTFTTTADDDAWHHIAVVRSGTDLNNISVYVDGGIATTRSDNSAFLTNQLRFGGDYHHWNEGINAYISDAAIWDEALTSTRVAELAAGAAVVPEPTTTALLGLGGLALIFRRRK